jgi:MYXO-CTERM domain-containing protein
MFYFSAEDDALPHVMMPLTAAATAFFRRRRLPGEPAAYATAA